MNLFLHEAQVLPDLFHILQNHLMKLIFKKTFHKFDNISWHKMIAKHGFARHSFSIPFPKVVLYCMQCITGSHVY